MNQFINGLIYPPCRIWPAAQDLHKFRHPSYKKQEREIVQLQDFNKHLPVYGHFVFLKGELVFKAGFKLLCLERKKERKKKDLESNVKCN